MIAVTETALNKIKEQLAKRGKGVGIRLGVKRTGCSGFAYTMEYLDDVDSASFDITVETTDGVHVLYDKKNDFIFNGMQLDYVKKGLNEGFEFSNPNEKGRCGCGESFSV